MINKLIALHEKIKALEHYIRMLKDRYKLLEQQVIPEMKEHSILMTDDYRIEYKQITTARLPEIKSNRAAIINYLLKNHPQAVKQTVHPLTLIKLLDMGILDNCDAKDTIRIETKEAIAIKPLDEAKAELKDQELLQKLKIA